METEILEMLETGAIYVSSFDTEKKVVFPYGNKYGWGIGHYKKKKLICNIFAENGAFTVMMRLTNGQDYFDKSEFGEC